MRTQQDAGYNRLS